MNGKNEKVLKKDIIAVIYKDGKHHLYFPASTAAGLLWSERISGDPSYSLVRANEDKSKASQPSSQLDSAAKPLVDTPRKLVFEDFAKEVPKEEFIKKATDKTQRFTQYLKILYDKSADNDQKNKAIEQAITLFVNENAEVEVSSINKEESVKHYKIRKYLQHVKLVNYDKIEIEWTNVQYVSDVRKGQMAITTVQLNSSKYSRATWTHSWFIAISRAKRLM